MGNAAIDFKYITSRLIKIISDMKYFFDGIEPIIQKHIIQMVFRTIKWNIYYLLN